MKALILAAGLGKRLGDLTFDTPKCLLRVKDRPLLDILLTMLDKAGVNETIVVAGYLEDKVKEFCKNRCAVIVNDKYEITNNIYSVWSARLDLRGEDFVILNCDVIYEEPLLVDFLRNEKRTACLIDNTVPFRENEFHVLVKQGKIVQYSKDISAKESGGESAQLVKISAPDSKLYLDRIHELVQDGLIQNYHISAYDRLIEKAIIWPIFTMGRKWYEIDNRQDYEHFLNHADLMPRP